MEKSNRSGLFRHGTFGFGIAVFAVALMWAGLSLNARADTDGEDCYTAVYDQQTDGTYAHYARGQWDTDRALCVRARNFTRSFLGRIGGPKAAQDSPDIHVMYVIDRTAGRIYAPCGINVDPAILPSGVLPPGTYDLSLTRLDSSVPDLGEGANCQISG